LYKNGDIYNGQFHYGKFDGYGVYEYAIGVRYIGFFSYDHFHGVGTYETSKEITKGTWRQYIKHGIFHTKDKITKKCTRIVFVDGKRISEFEVSVFDDNFLKTTPNKKMEMKKQVVKYKCSICGEKNSDMRLFGCGHSTCVTCLTKYKKCPYCRVKPTNVVKLYIADE
jgi:hypothetical protein